MKIKNILLALLALVAASTIVYAASEKITIYRGANALNSYNVSEISNISYSGDSNGVDRININFKNGTSTTYNLDRITSIEYTPEVDDYVAIYEEFDEHCEIIVLDNYYNDSPDDYSKHYHKCAPGLGVHYVYTVESGYDIEISIIGQRTGHNYREDDGFEFEDDYTGTGFAQAATAFLMPNEPVAIKGVTTERNLYPNESFIGKYDYGFWINETLDNHVLSTTNPMMKVELIKNGVFQVSSTDKNQFDFKGTFTYDAASKSFSYNRDDCKKYGINGRILSDDMILITVRDILEDKPDNTNFYWLSRKPINFVRATGNQRDGNYILEIGSGNSKEYYLYNTHTYSLLKATAEFSRGTTLGGICTAILSYNEAPYAISYTLNSATGNPTILYANDERGSYNGSEGTLWLDGFGGAQFGSTQGSYTINGIEVTFTPNNGGSKVVFHINKNAKTYEKIVNNTGWNGPEHYSTRFSGGQVATTYNNIDNSVFELWLNHDWSGNSATGKAKLVMRVDGNSLADQTVEYVYNASNNTITLSYEIAYYSAAGWVIEDQLVLKVSNDKRTLTFDYGYLSTYATTGYAWFVGSGTVLAAE